MSFSCVPHAADAVGAVIVSNSHRLSMSFRENLFQLTVLLSSYIKISRRNVDTRAHKHTQNHHLINDVRSRPSIFSGQFDVSEISLTASSSSPPSNSNIVINFQLNLVLIIISNGGDNDRL